MSTPVSLVQLFASYSAAESVYSAYEESKNNAEKKSESRSSKQLVQAVANVALSAGALRALRKASPLSFAAAAGIGIGYSFIKNKVIEKGQPTRYEQQMMDGSVSGSLTGMGLTALKKLPVTPAISVGFIAGGAVPIVRHAIHQASQSFQPKTVIPPSDKV